MTAVPAVVYLMAFACEPGRGSEPGVGFAFAAAAARFAKETGSRAVLVTRPHRIELIAAALGDDAEHIELLPVALPRVLVRFTGRPLVRIAFIVWQRRAVRVVRERMRMDPRRAIVHHVTFATEALPTFEWSLATRAALVYGPAGSATTSDRHVLDRLRRRVRGQVAKANLRPVDVLIAQNSAVAASWSGFGGVRIVEPNVVIEASYGERPPLRWVAVTAGRLIARKRVDLAIRAFAESGVGGRMAVIGDGPERARLVRAAQRAGVDSRVDFLGDLPRSNLLTMIASSATLLHPSRQEGAGWVVGEAQAVGTMPIVFEGSGADSLVHLAGIGQVARDVRGMAAALESATAVEPSPSSDRWSEHRLPGKLAEWYGLALERASSRLGDGRA